MTRFASFAVDGVQGYGIVDADGLTPVAPEFQARFPTLASVLAADCLADAAASAAGQRPLDPNSTTVLPPVPRPGKILCVGMNYAAHIREMGREPPAYPALFIRFPDSLVGHGQPVVRPRVSREFDYEGELAVVIGRVARHVHRDRALDVVAGYTCLLDGSARDWQRHTSQFTAGKNFRHSGAVGPWLVTRDELPDPRALTLQTRVNGERRQHAPVADLCIDVPAMIEYLSTICQLEPGDLISTGTPSGVGYADDPPRYLEPGDVVEVEISGIGTLRNPVVDEPA